MLVNKPQRVLPSVNDVCIRMRVWYLQVYDVLKPNKHFSKGNPDDPKLVVCLSTGPCVPTFRVMQQLQQQVSPLPLQYAKVAGGEVAFHSMQSLV